MRRTKEEASLTREALLKAALTVFSRKGYAATTLEDVAREAGVTRGAIYWHFGSKAELYNALLDTHSARSQEVVQQAVIEGGTLREILHRVFVRLLEAVQANDELRAVMELSLFKTERTPDLAAGRRQQIEGTRVLLAGITQAMQQGVASGELRSDVDPAEMARAFLALQNGTIYMWLLDRESFSLQQSADALASVLLEGIVWDA